MKNEQSILEKKLLAKICIFFVMAFCISLSLNLLPNPLSYIGYKINLNYAFGPFISAIVVSYFYKTPLLLSLFSKNRLIRRIEFIGIGIFVIGTLLSYIQTGKSNYPLFCLGIFLSLIYNLLEEAGWRVFLGNELSKYSFWIILTVSTTLWFFWHYSFGDENLLSNPLQFFVLILGGSAGMAKFYIQTKSWMIVALTHAIISVNFPTLIIFLVVTIGLLKYNEKQYVTKLS
jgi:Type II CAAX prenyl endopeptidase Rce1-like